MDLSTEALEELASRVRSHALVRIRARLHDEPPPPGRAPDPAPLAGAYPKMRALDPALGVWLAETVQLVALDAPSERYDREWRKYPVELRGEPLIDVRGLASALAGESNSARRAAVMKAADDRALDHLDVARAMVDAFRGVADALAMTDGAALAEALGWIGPAAIAKSARAVLDATDEVFRETDDWVRARLALPRGGELSWSDRLRTVARERTTELVPLADRVGIASRWLARCGLESALNGVRDLTRPVATMATGVWAHADEPGSRATLFGTPARTVHGVVSFAAATCEAALGNTAKAPRLAQRAGVDRVHCAVASVLGRRLFLEPSFLTREAGIDRGALEPVSLELLHAELCASRLEAGRGLFAIDVITRASDLPARLREHMVRAVGTAPVPAWAAHECATWALTHPGAQSVALALEPMLRATLRDRYDDDWFRNPRAGEWLSDRFTAMRLEGTVATFARDARVEGNDPLAVITPGPLATRTRDVFHAATA